MGPLFLERKTIFLGVVIVALSFVIGVLVGYFGSGDSSNTQMLNSLVIDQVSSMYPNSRTVFPLEARSFGGFWCTHFLAPANSTRNSASYGPKIMPKVQL